MTVEAGVESFMGIVSSADVDFDDDGDLDLVTATSDGPIWVDRNRTRGARSIFFELEDGRGNRKGIGSRVTIHYGPGSGRHQVRELKASGGYLSLDPPRLHFGLGEHRRVARVEIHWSTGETTALEGAFESGYRYRIRRRPR